MPILRRLGVTTGDPECIYYLSDHYTFKNIEVDMCKLSEHIEKDNILKKYILEIINSDIYKDYVHGQKFKNEYRGLVFNSNMIRI